MIKTENKLVESSGVSDRLAGPSVETVSPQKQLGNSLEFLPSLIFYDLA